MDKFDRRPSPAARRRKLLYFFLAFALVGGWFAALFAFGNAGAIWLIAIYVFGLTLAALARGADFWRNYRLWLGTLRLQSAQGPGFSALETAAITRLVEQAGDQGPALLAHLKYAEVVARYNSGAGSVTSLKHPNAPLGKDLTSDAVAWFSVQGIDGLVGARLWTDDTGSVACLEFFTGGENTTRLEWATLAFDEAWPTATRPAVPTVRPMVTEPRSVRYRPET